MDEAWSMDPLYNPGELGATAIDWASPLGVDGIYCAVASFLGSDQLVALAVACKSFSTLTQLREVQDVWRIRFDQRWPFLKKRGPKINANWLQVFRYCRSPPLAVALTNGSHHCPESRVKRDAERERRGIHFKKLEVRVLTTKYSINAETKYMLM
jgi:hypothetical protein